MDNIKERLALIELACRLRNEVIIERANKGETLHSIGMDYGLSRQRVHQIIAAYKRAARRAAAQFPTLAEVENKETVNE